MMPIIKSQRGSCDCGSRGKLMTVNCEWVAGPGVIVQHNLLSNNNNDNNRATKHKDIATKFNYCMFIHVSSIQHCVRNLYRWMPFLTEIHWSTSSFHFIISNIILSCSLQHLCHSVWPKPLSHFCPVRCACQSNLMNWICCSTAIFEHVQNPKICYILWLWIPAPISTCS